jgi:hypothetical protein
VYRKEVASAKFVGTVGSMAGAEIVTSGGGAQSPSVIGK